MSTTNKARDRGSDGKLLYKYRRSHERHWRSTPKWWRKLHMTRPKRHENSHICWQILRGADPDGLACPLGNHKPHVYYW